MHAHFRLFGPERFTGSAEVEKDVASRILQKLYSSGSELCKLDRGGKSEGVLEEEMAWKSEFCGYEVLDV